MQVLIDPITHNDLMLKLKSYAFHLTKMHNIQDVAGKQLKLKNQGLILVPITDTTTKSYVIKYANKQFGEIYGTYNTIGLNI